MNNIDDKTLVRARKVFKALGAKLETMDDSGRTSEVVLARLAEDHGLMDPGFYLAAYPDVAAAGINPSIHYVRHGFKEGRKPNRWFEATWLDDVSWLHPSRKSFHEFVQAINHGLAASAISQNEPAQKPIAKDEKTFILRQGCYEVLYDMPLFVNWMLTDMCNYRCSYCFGQKPINKNNFVPFSKLLHAVDNLYAFNRPLYDITLSGGEPTIHPNFIELLYVLVAKFGKRLNKIFIISNGSRDLSFYNQLATLSELTPITLLISIHTEYAKIEHICDIIKQYDKNLCLMFNLMLHPNKFNEIKSIIEKLFLLRNNYYFAMSPVILREPPDYSLVDKRYNEEFINWQKKIDMDFKDLCKKSNLSPKYKIATSFSFFRNILKDNSIITETVINRSHES